MESEKPLRRRSVSQQAKNTAWIYALLHPSTKEVRYVGQTCRSMKFRYREHLRAATKGEEWPVSCWIRKLLAKGLRPDVQELEFVPENSSWQDAETKWIAHYKAILGNRSLNITSGGDGTRGYKYSLEQRAKLSVLAKAQNRKPPGNKGRVFSDEVRANMSAAQKGKPGKKWTKEQRANYLANRKYEPWSEEMRKKCMEGHKRRNYRATAEDRESMSNAAKSAWALRKAGISKSSPEERAAGSRKRRTKKLEKSEVLASE